MANSYSLSIDMKDENGNKIARTITNINPNASAVDILNLTQGLVNLTANVYQGTSKIIKAEIVDKITPNIILPPSEQTISLSGDEHVATFVSGVPAVDWSKVGLPYIKKNTSWLLSRIYVNKTDPYRPYTLFGIPDAPEDDTFDIDGTPITTPGEIVVVFPESDTYNAVEITITVTE